jgi:hypothetical protein
MTALDAAKALDKIGDTEARRREGKPPPIAMCRVCPNEPLVSTMLFRRAEFYCVSCGSHLGYLDPKPAEPTPELDDRAHAVQQEFDTLSKGALSLGGMHRDCSTCMEHRQPHIEHATPDELKASVAAYERLRERAAKGPPA